MKFCITPDQRPADEGPQSEVKTEEKVSSVHEKVHNLRDLLRQLQSGTLPGYLSRLSKLEAQHEERIQKCHVDKEIELQMVGVTMILSWIIFYFLI